MAISSHPVHKHEHDLEAIRIRHPDHEHDLELKNFEKPYTCDGCKEQGFGVRYRCEQCNFDLHEDCVFTDHKTSHDFFKKATFEFLYQKPDDSERFCDGCGKGIHGYLYHCKEEGWDLHPCCANLKKELSIEGEIFKLRKKVSSKCIWCNQRELNDSGIPGWSYVSKCDKYHFHVYCATEMVLQGWKNGSLSKDKDNCLALENLKQLPIQAKNRNRKNRGGNKILRIVKVFLKTIACILLGDPTITLACLLLDVVTS